MSQPAVGPGLDEFVIFTKGGGVAPLFAEMTGGDPDQRNRRGSEDHGCDHGRRRFVEADRANISPHQGETNHDQ